MLSWLKFGRLAASEPDRASALATPPLEHLDKIEERATFVGGNQSLKGALPVSTDLYDAAIFSCRGKGYARYNEDAAVLFKDERGHLYAGAFDQAGGLGGLTRGDGSRRVASECSIAFRKIATAGLKADVQHHLQSGINAAHAELVGRQQGEVSTAVLLVARKNQVEFATSGDSSAMLFNAQGNLPKETVKHTLDTPYNSGALTHAVGLAPEGPNTEVGRWDLQVGQWIILASDGLLDCGMREEDWFTTVRAEKSAEDGVNALARMIMRRMALLRGKPDNLTIVALHRRDLIP